MNGCNSTEIDETNLTDKTKFRLNEVTKIENYFNLEINQRKSCIKNLMKYVAGFGYIDKILIVLSATSGGLRIIFSVSVVGVPIGIAGASFTLIFSLTTGMIKTLLSITRSKKKNHNKIFMLAQRKLTSTETLVPQALIDMEMSHEEFIKIMKEKDKYEKMKENARNVSECSTAEKQENMRLNSVNSTTKKNRVVDNLQN